jgi:hypothetical protein
MIALGLLCTLPVAAQQDVTAVRTIVDTLTSRSFEGRGYTHDGMAKAAQYIQNTFQGMGLQPLSGKSYLQPFTYPVNTFPGKVQLRINDVVLEPGKDFIPSPESNGVKAKGRLVQKDATHFLDPEHRIIVTSEKKLTWSVAQEAVDYTVIQIDSVKFAALGTPSTIDIDLENKVNNRFKATNVCGMVKGTLYPDSVIFLTAHYDHLGGLGTDTYFPGANDNASGISLLLTLAKYYSTHPQPYSIGFICFAGEEAGLLGSAYYTQHPLLPLKQIRFLLNIDMVGTGEEGITVVNATEYPAAFAALQQLNRDKQYIVDVKARGKAANSDHYNFSEKGVPAFFIYTLGGIRAYHDVFDVAATLPLTEINDLSCLIKDFFHYLQH